MNILVTKVDISPIFETVLSHVSAAQMTLQSHLNANTNLSYDNYRTTWYWSVLKTVKAGQQ